MSIEDTLAERGDRYGSFEHHATIAQELQDTMRAQDGWTRLAPDQKQALTVIADKIARMLNGDPAYRDNWHDIVGYAKLVDDRMARDELAKLAPQPIDIPEALKPQPIKPGNCLVCGEFGSHYGLPCPKAVPVAHFGGVPPAAPVASTLPVDFSLAGKKPPARPREGQTHIMEIFKHTGERFTSVWGDVVHNEDWSQVLGYRFNASAPLPPAYDGHD